MILCPSPHVKQVSRHSVRRHSEGGLLSRSLSLATATTASLQTMWRRQAPATCFGCRCLKVNNGGTIIA